MSYTALYRKFRPDTFEDVKGQDPIVNTLKNQIKANRVGHAYLFCGTRGTGKTTMAKILAKAVNCENPQDGNPCGECAICKSIAAGTSMNVIEIDAASNNGVDNIREIVEEVAYSPAEGKYKVYIIDEVHMLSIGAFNALLKTLEEPPEYVIFILATTEVHKIPITILSRCQRYDVKRITIDTITQRMQELIVKEEIQVEDRALRYIARTADGSMRDALSLLDQCIAFHYGQELTYDKVLDVLGAVDTEIFSKMLRLILESNVAGTITLLEEIVVQGRELTQFVTDFTMYLRNLLLLKTSDGMEDVIGVSTENLARLKEEAQMAPLDIIMRYIRIFSELSGQIRYAAQKRIMIEIALIKLCKPSMETDNESLLDRIRQLEERFEKGVPMIQQTATVAAGTPAVPKERPKLPQAVPEDVKQVVERWASIIESAPNPMKNYLRKARLSLSGDAKLLVALSEIVAIDYFTKHQENKEALETLLSDAISREITVVVQGVESDQVFNNTMVDLTDFIDMEVIEEDDEEIEP